MVYIMGMEVFHRFPLISASFRSNGAPHAVLLVLTKEAMYREGDKRAAYPIPIPVSLEDKRCTHPRRPYR
jgi:hypothetical protein